MHTSSSLPAALSLAMAMGAATLGTILQADPSSAGRESVPCVTQDVRMVSSLDTWEASITRAMCRTQDGFLRMAGMAKVH